MQRDSTKLRPVEEQLPLLGSRRAPSKPVSLEHIRLLRSPKDALDYACMLAGVVPKEVYQQMDYDKTAWSRIASGERELVVGEVRRFSKVVGNDALLFYLSHTCEFDIFSMKKVKTSEEQRIAELEQENADLRRAVSLCFEAQKAGR